MAFSKQTKVKCHEPTEINVVYTNMASSVDAWIDKVEVMLAAAKIKVVGVDSEYTRKCFRPQKGAVLQLCVGKECLVYHACNADENSVKLKKIMKNWRYTFAGFDIKQDIRIMKNSEMYIPSCCFKDIQSIWSDPDLEKRGNGKQGLKDLASAIINVCYKDMKDDFGEKEHNMWAEEPLPRKHLEYAARDAYVAYELYVRLDKYKRGFISIEKNPSTKARDW